VERVVTNIDTWDFAIGRMRQEDFSGFWESIAALLYPRAAPLGCMKSSGKCR
jgi:hypothetical protein